MKFFKTFGYLSEQLIRRFHKKRSDTFSFERQPNFFKKGFWIVGGSIYHRYQVFKETWRVRRKKNEIKLGEYGILFEVTKYSKEILFLLTGSFLILLVADLAVVEMLKHLNLGWFWRIEQQYNFITSPDENFLITSMEIFIGGISAILGLIFALYAVGIQLVTDKYSSGVSEYINQERFGSFLFKFLIFTDIFSILMLLRIKMINIPLSISFVTILVLVCISLLSILIFKDDFVLKLKPNSLYGRLGSEIIEDISTAADLKRYTYTSISVVRHAQDRAKKRLQLLKTLFADLYQAKNWADLIFMPVVLASIITEYGNKKRYIDRDRAWWFPQVQEEVKSDNLSILPIKLNFELQGKGPLRIGVSDYRWFEKMIFSTIDFVESKITGTPDIDQLTGQVIDFYGKALNGDYDKDGFGRYKKSQKGLYENQEFEMFETAFQKFLDFYKKVETENHVSHYLSNLFVLGITLIEGFDYDELSLEIESLITNEGVLCVSQKNVRQTNLPTAFYGLITDYWARLQLEMECEGRVVTPVDLLKKEIVRTARGIEKKKFDEYFTRLTKHQDHIYSVLLAKKEYKQLALLVKMRLEWFSRLLAVNKAEIANQYAYLIGDLCRHLLLIPKEIVVELEFWEQIEKLAFPSMIENQLELFVATSSVLSDLLVIINDGETDVEKHMYRNRLVLMVGAYAFILGELRQDQGLLIAFMGKIEKHIRPGFVERMFEIWSNPRAVGGLGLVTKLIYSETTRYHHWFAQVCQEIDQLPKTHDEVEFYSGLHEVADHPSQFIRQISYHCYNPEEKASEALLEWVKRREQIKKLIAILNKK